MKTHLLTALLILVCSIVFVAFYLITSRTALQQECIQWADQSIKYGDSANFYFTQWQVDQCNDLDLPLPENIPVI